VFFVVKCIIFKRFADCLILCIVKDYFHLNHVVSVYRTCVSWSFTDGLLQYNTRGVPMSDGAGSRNKFGAPWSNLRCFGRKCTVLKKSLATWDDFFALPSYLAPEDFCPLPPSVHCTKRLCDKLVKRLFAVKKLGKFA